MTVFLSESVQNILNGLGTSQHGTKRSHIPPMNLARDISLRTSPKESLHQWFVRVVDIFGGIEKCSISDNMACVGSVHWEDGIVTYANLQILAVKVGNIEDYYLSSKDDNGFQSQYFRMEYDSTMPGPFFKEPLPHVHTIPDREPRFPLRLTSSKTMIVDFLEFLYLNYQYDKWYMWAREIWKKNNIDDDEGIFDTICKAYEKGQIEVIKKKYADAIQRLKNMLKWEKEEISKCLACLPDVVSLLNYNNPIQ